MQTCFSELENLAERSNHARPNSECDRSSNFVDDYGQFFLPISFMRWRDKSVRRKDMESFGAATSQLVANATEVHYVPCPTSQFTDRLNISLGTFAIAHSSSHPSKCIDMCGLTPVAAPPLKLKHQLFSRGFFLFVYSTFS